MGIRAMIDVDDDRWAKRAYGVTFNDSECQAEFGVDSLRTRRAAENQIARARAAGYDIDEVVDRHF